jgi:hypothetical protein
MTRNPDSIDWDFVNRQAANALLTATLSFLRVNKISKRQILDAVRQHYGQQKPKVSIRQYRNLVRVYEEMGIVMSTWFSLPKFLDKECRPLPLTIGRGPRSILSLVRASRVSISPTEAIALMRRSPSVAADVSGNLIAQRREFVLPGFAVPRAALVIERYLDTLHRNSSPSKRKRFLLLERNCHVPEVNFRTIAPVLRDIKRRGSAYIDSVNGDIEGLRVRRSRRKGAGEMSVHLFAWTRLSRARRSKPSTKFEN